ncbi:hypothetical protein HK405_005917 [Cladochytrium tenue]|nr:hypothetical protein HK405_005917 [Cladochytrium tenue]
MLQGGDFTKGDGRGGQSIYGKGPFADESFARKHDQPFLLSMANKGPDTNGSQFFITSGPTPHLVAGMDVFRKIEALPVDASDRPYDPVTIANCGELIRRTSPLASKEAKSTVAESRSERPKKRKPPSSSSSSSDSDSDSDSDSSSSSSASDSDSDASSSSSSSSSSGPSSSSASTASSGAKKKSKKSKTAKKKSKTKESKEKKARSTEAVTTAPVPEFNSEHRFLDREYKSPLYKGREREDRAPRVQVAERAAADAAPRLDGQGRVVKGRGSMAETLVDPSFHPVEGRNEPESPWVVDLHGRVLPRDASVRLLDPGNLVFNGLGGLGAGDGRTVEELSFLLRSRLAAQRAVSLRTLRALVARLKDGGFSAEAQRDLDSEMRRHRTVLSIRHCLDDSNRTVIALAVGAIRECLRPPSSRAIPDNAAELWPLASHGTVAVALAARANEPPVEPEQGETTLADILALIDSNVFDGLVSTNILTRLEYLLTQMDDDDAVVEAVLSLIHAFAQASLDISMQLLARRRITDRLLALSQSDSAAPRRSRLLALKTALSFSQCGPESATLLLQDGWLEVCIDHLGIGGQALAAGDGASRELFIAASRILEVWLELQVVNAAADDLDHILPGVAITCSGAILQGLQSRDVWLCAAHSWRLTSAWAKERLAANVQSASKLIDTSIAVVAALAALPDNELKQALLSQILQFLKTAANVKVPGVTPTEWGSVVKTASLSLHSFVRQLEQFDIPSAFSRPAVLGHPSSVTTARASALVKRTILCNCVESSLELLSSVVFLARERKWDTIDLVTVTEELRALLVRVNAISGVPGRLSGIDALLGSGFNQLRLTPWIIERRLNVARGTSSDVKSLIAYLSNLAVADLSRIRLALNLIHEVLGGKIPLKLAGYYEELFRVLSAAEVGQLFFPTDSALSRMDAQSTWILAPILNSAGEEELPVPASDLVRVLGYLVDTDSLPGDQYPNELLLYSIGHLFSISDVFLGPTVEPTLLRLLARLTSPPFLSTAALDTISAPVPFLTLYTALVGEFEARSFHSRPFLLFLVAPLAMSYPAIYRRIFWGELAAGLAVAAPCVLPIAELPGNDASASDPTAALDAFFTPAERDPAVLEAQRSFLAEVAGRGRRPGPHDALCLIAAHHVRAAAAAARPPSGLTAPHV